jgi:hypothetical protein
VQSKSVGRPFERHHVAAVTVINEAADQIAEKIQEVEAKRRDCALSACDCPVINVDCVRENRPLSVLEFGWARVRNTITHSHACLIALPDGEQIPPPVEPITGIVRSLIRIAVVRVLE